MRLNFPHFSPNLLCTRMCERLRCNYAYKIGINMPFRERARVFESEARAHTLTRTLVGLAAALGVSLSGH